MAPPGQHLALGLLLLSATMAMVSAKQAMLVDHLLGSAETVQAANARPAAYEDDTTSVCFTETTACGIWGQDELIRDREGTWTSTLACSDCHSGAYDEEEHHKQALFYPSSGPAGWCFFRHENYTTVRDLPFGSAEGIQTVGWFDVACYFGEGDKHTCLPDDCSETQLFAAGPFFGDDAMLFTVDPRAASKPTRCQKDKDEYGVARMAASVATASASTSEYLDTPLIYYQGKGNIYAAAGSLYSRRGPFKSAPRSVWFQYIWTNYAQTFDVITGSIGDRTAYTPWSYTIDFPTSRKHEYRGGYRK